jgi:hypothetical protein
VKYLLRIPGQTTPVYNLKRRIVGWLAEYGGLLTTQHEYRDEAGLALKAMIEFRCSEESAKVHVVTLCGHTGIFSYSISGHVDCRHVWPNGRVAVAVSPHSIAFEEQTFRYHVAQLTWDRLSSESNIVPPAMRKEFKSWCEFQWRYTYAREVLGMVDGTAYGYATNSNNPHQAASAA